MSQQQQKKIKQSLQQQNQQHQHIIPSTIQKHNPIQQGSYIPYINHPPNNTISIKNISQLSCKQICIILLVILSILITIIFIFQIGIFSSSSLFMIYQHEDVLLFLQNMDKIKDNQKNKMKNVMEMNKISQDEFKNAVKKLHINKISDINEQNQIIRQLIKQDEHILQNKYNISKYDTDQLTFCIILPSMQQIQNKQYISIIQSILYQNYTNYKIIFPSLPQSFSTSLKPKFNYLLSYLKKSSNSQSSYLFIQKSSPLILNNIFFGIKQHCKQNQIIMIINQIDRFVGVNVLRVYNAYYHMRIDKQEQFVNFVYSQYMIINDVNKTIELGDLKQINQIVNGNGKQVKLNDYKKFNQIPLISFKYQLFSQIQISTLTNQKDQFYNQTWQKAILIQLIQLLTNKNNNNYKQSYLNQITYAINIKQNNNQKKNLNYFKQIQQIISKVQNKRNMKNFVVTNNHIKENIKNNIKKELNNIKKQVDQAQTTDQQSQQNLHNNKNNKNNKNNAKFSQKQQQLREPILKPNHENDRDPLRSPNKIPKSQQDDDIKLRTPKINNKFQKVNQEDNNINENQHKKRNNDNNDQEVNNNNNDNSINNINNNNIQPQESSPQPQKQIQVLPNDQAAFLQDQQLQIAQQKRHKPTSKPSLSPIIITQKQKVKGSNYHFQIPIQKMSSNTDIGRNFGKRKSKQGIWRNQYVEAIEKLQITHNVKYGGQIELELSPFDSDRIEKKNRIQKLISRQSQYLQSTYKISQYKKKQLPFCIVIPSYNNIKTGLYLRNLNSIFMQDYTNYHVVYIDDASTDKTHQYIRSYINQNQIPKQKIQIIVNKQNRKPPFSIYNAITNHCKMGELALIVQGDDALIGTNVLNLYNAVYQRDKAAMVYSSYLDIFNNSIADVGFGHQVMEDYFQKNSIRTIWEIPAKYLLSFYVDIFKSIKAQDFKDPRGYFFWYAYDRALVTPLLQISYPRITVVKQILYEHRHDTDKKQSIQDWNRQSNQILAKKPYKPLKFFPFIQRNKYKYVYDVPIQKVVQNSDFYGYTAEKNFQQEGITKQMHIRSIRMTQIIHNVDFHGDVKVQLTQFEQNKDEKQIRMKRLLEEDKNYYNQKYNIDDYRKNQLPFCILTPSYNNVKSGLYLRNLDSVFMQDYKNYHVVYIDDASPDKTGEFVKKYLQQKKIPKQKIQIIINKQNKKALANIHLGIHKYCKSGQIVAIIDGDDSFIGRNVLSLFNAMYQQNNAAMAYSNFLTIHNNDRTQLGFCHDINKEQFSQNTFRNSWDLPGTHLMTFYSDVFKKIKISDLTYENGTFYDYAYDRAILTPLLQMAYPRIAVIKQITYEYRNDTGINDSPDDWIRVSHIILDKKPYAHLQDYPFIQGFIISTDKFNFKTSIQAVIKNTDFSSYQKQKNHKISNIAKQQHIHAIRLSELVHNINFKGEIDISIKTKNFQKKKERLSKLLKSDLDYLQAKYDISRYQSYQLPFCIVVSSYGNVQNGLYLRNLDSLMMQNYKNYHVVYIDDASPDQANQYVKKYIQQKNIPSQLLKIIINKQTKKQLANIYYAAHNQCSLGQIMLILQGNDALIGMNVLKILNALYQKEKAAMGYSCFLKVLNNNSTELGTCNQIEKFYFQTNTLRNKLQAEKYRLMSFYTDIFRRIKVTDLTFENGTFFNNAADKAIMTPLLQMSYPNILVVKEILYEYRNDKGIQDISSEGTITNLVLGKRPYDRIVDKSFAERYSKNNLKTSKA